MRALRASPPPRRRRRVRWSPTRPSRQASTPPPPETSKVRFWGVAPGALFALLGCGGGTGAREGPDERASTAWVVLHGSTVRRYGTEWRRHRGGHDRIRRPTPACS